MGRGVHSPPPRCIWRLINLGIAPEELVAYAEMNDISSKCMFERYASHVLLAPYDDQSTPIDALVLGLCRKGLADLLASAKDCSAERLVPHS